MATHHLAQLNVGHMLAPLDSPTMADFMGQLDAINAIADAAPGFVWRLQTEDGNATAMRPTDAEALERLAELQRNGPTPHAFSFRSLFPAPDASGATLDALPDECPAT